MCQHCQAGREVLGACWRMSWVGSQCGSGEERPPAGWGAHPGQDLLWVRLARRSPGA